MLFTCRIMSAWTIISTLLCLMFLVGCDGRAAYCRTRKIGHSWRCVDKVLNVSGLEFRMCKHSGGHCLFDSSEKCRCIVKRPFQSTIPLEFHREIENSPAF